MRNGQQIRVPLFTNIRSFINIQPMAATAGWQAGGRRAGVRSTS